VRWAIGIGILLLIVAFLPTIIGGRGRADFNAPASVDSIRQTIASGSLQVCSEQPLDWSATPGFVRGEYVQISRDCSANPAGARVWIVQFDSLDARDTALLNAEAAYRRPIGTVVTWSAGPVAIIVDGNQDPATIAALQSALAGRATAA
jgi:hypothetical protein